MYTPLGKRNTKPQQVENTDPTQEFVPPTDYDIIIQDRRTYDLRTTIEIPQYTGEPTESQYREKSYVRFFAQHKSSGKVLEISKQTYLDLKNQSTLYHYPSYFIGSLQWRLNGPVADQEINGYIVEGAQTANEYYISELEKVLPNIRTYLTDPSQFVK